MKKLLLVPAVVAVAAISSASAAGFGGGVSAGPLQVGQTNDLECAASAKITEWGYNDHEATPNVVNALVELAGADCVGQSVTVLPLTAGSIQLGPRAAAKVPAQVAVAGVQKVRVQFDTPMNAADLKSVRISIDPGHAGIPVGGAS